MKRVLWFAFFLIVAVSCLNEPDCYRQNLNMVGISFKKMYDGTVDTVGILEAYADGIDSLFYASVNETRLDLPLNYLSTSTAFTIEGVERTFLIGFTHSSKTQFVSEDCGSRFIVSDLNVTSHSFDSLRLVSNSLSNPAHINIEVFRCPRTNIMRFAFRQLYMDTVRHGRADTRRVNALDADFIPVTLLPDTTNLSAVLLPINTAAESVTYHFNLDNNEERTFKVNYHSTEKQVLTKCDVQKFFGRLELAEPETDFERIRVTVDSIHDPPYTNVVSYRCPTTNNIKVLFRRLNGSSKVNDTLKITSLTDDFSGSPIYTNTNLSTVVLPLNPNATTVTYTFAQQGGTTNTLTLGYTATPTTFHEMCGSQTVFSDIEIVSTNFTDPEDADVLDSDAQFPVINNIEILR